jgi:CelD/BcsL family acetyltransferase involved in cellulose biosynthesis
MASLSARMVPIDRLSEADMEAWRDLAKRAAEPNPFMEPDLVLPAATHLGLPSPHLLMVGSGSGSGSGVRLEACVAVNTGVRLRTIPLPHVRIWRHLYAPLGTPLVDRDRVDQATDGVVELLRSEAGLVRTIVLEWVGEGGPVAEGLRRAFAARGQGLLAYRTFWRGVFRRGSPAGPASKHRRTRALGRALQREAGSPVATVDRAGDPAAVEGFLELEASGWKGRSGTALLRRPGHAEFFRDMCARFAVAGRLELRSMEVAGRPVAMTCSLRAGDGLFQLKSAYDEAYAKYSPGVLIQLDAMDRVSSAPEGSSPSWIDSCTDPDNPVINRLYAERRELSVLMAPPRSKIGRWPVATMLRIVRRPRREGGGPA